MGAGLGGCGLGTLALRRALERTNAYDVKGVLGITRERAKERKKAFFMDIVCGEARFDADLCVCLCE